MGIILNEYQEEFTSINLETSKRNPIANSQSFLLGSFEVTHSQSLENHFSAQFQGEPLPIYNCHGLTFASRRTGIYEDKEILKILDDEYREIKSERHVLIGDIVIYYDSENNILHSGVVIKAECKDQNDLPNIEILSKIRKYKEIVHNANHSPYGPNRKFYRIRHEYKIID